MGKGLFKDAFDVGAGATLGSLTVMTGYTIGSNIIDNTVRNAFETYRSQYFDPVIRQDLCELMVKGLLPAAAYPFPSNQIPAEKANFFKRHMIFTVVLIWMIVNIIYLPFSGKTDADILSYGLSVMLVFFMGIGLVLLKIFKAGGRKLVQHTYKSELENAGQEYWYVREYIRQALARHELSVEDSIRKISNTQLARIFPDTVEKIEANAFYYRQRIGM